MGRKSLLCVVCQGEWAVGEGWDNLIGMTRKAIRENTVQ